MPTNPAIDTRHRQINTFNRIYGYFIPRPNETQERAFQRAKAELVENLKADIADAEAMTLAAFETLRTR